MDKKDKTVLEALKIRAEDFEQMVGVMQRTEIGMDLKAKAELVNKLDIKKKEHCFALFISKMLMDTTANIVTDFFTESPRLSQDAVGDLRVARDAFTYMSAFLQATVSDNSSVKLLSIFIPVAMLMASPITPLSIAVDLFVKLMKLHKFTYDEILVGVNTFLEVIDPSEQIPKEKVN